jgi:glycosyltransferase involved in cell wall biosynthesis
LSQPDDQVASSAVREICGQEPRVRLITNSGRKLAGALNSGMKAAATEFVAILLSDDRWVVDAIEILETNITLNPGVDLFHSGLSIIDGRGRYVGIARRPPEKIATRDFVRGSPLKHLLCWRRLKALEFGGMDETLNNVGPDDFDFPWMMVEHGAVVKAIDEYLYEYRDHHESFRLTTHLPRSVHVREIRRIMRKHRVPWYLIEKQLWHARRGFLRQCIYRSRWQKWIRESLRRRRTSNE